MVSSVLSDGSRMLWGKASFTPDSVNTASFAFFCSSWIVLAPAYPMDALSPPMNSCMTLATSPLYGTHPSTPSGIPLAG